MPVLPHATGSQPAAFAFDDLVVEVRRHLHAHPEIGLEEHATSAYVRAQLEAHGLSPSAPLGGTGFYVEIEGAHPGPAVGYRADMDALPIQDGKTDVPYRSTIDGLAHLCGHDAHTAMALGVALGLNQRRDDIHGTVRVFFQPNEEGTPGGATLMIPDGVLEGLSGVFGVHVDPSLRVGQFGLRPGPMTASALSFKAFIRKNGTGHSARPHQGGDTVWVTHQVMSALYGMIGRVQDARDTAVLTICRLRAGEALNVIPSEVEFGGTIRCIDWDALGTLREHLVQAVKGVAELNGMEGEVQLQQGAPPVMNDPALTELVQATVRDVYGEQALVVIPRPSMGGEDFAHYAMRVPSAFVRVGTCSSDRTSYPVHHELFDLDEKALGLNVRLMSETLLRFLRERA